MDWDAFMRGELAIYCANKAQALALLDMFDAHGLDTAPKRELIRRADKYDTTCYSYRWDIWNQKLYSASLDQEASWEWHKENGFTRSVCRFSEIAEAMPNPSITTLDGLL